MGSRAMRAILEQVGGAESCVKDPFAPHTTTTTTIARFPHCHVIARWCACLGVNLCHPSPVPCAHTQTRPRMRTRIGLKQQPRLLAQQAGHRERNRPRRHLKWLISRTSWTQRRQRLRARGVSSIGLRYSASLLRGDSVSAN